MSGHAIEARLYAEDAEAGFLPATGRVLDLAWPADARVDTGLRVGDTVSDRYDPLLAKIVVHGATRPQALSRMREALAATRLLGVTHEPPLPALAVRQRADARRRHPD